MRPFDGLPDLFAGDVDATVSFVVDEALAVSPLVPGDFETHLVPTPSNHAAGALADPAFRRALLAVLAADWAVYADPFDRVDLARLALTMARYPRGFRVAFWTPEGGRPVPVGYTAHHPIDAATLARFRACDPTLLDRTFVPLPAPVSDGATYLFSYGLAPAFRRAPFARALLRELQASFERDEPRALAALCVSDAGVRVAARWGLTSLGAIEGPGGEREHVCVWEK